MKDRFLAVGWVRPAWTLAAALFVVFAGNTVFAQETLPPDVSASQQSVAETAPAAEAPEPATPAPAPAVPAPLVDDISGIALGMTADEVKGKLGKPDNKDATSMLYELDNGQQLQLKLDGDQKVMMVAAIYTGQKADAPEFTEVFGADAQAAPQANGTIYKIVRYPAAGYWVAYSRLTLDSGPMTTVTIQKMDQ